MSSSVKGGAADHAAASRAGSLPEGQASVVPAHALEPTSEELEEDVEEEDEGTGFHVTE